MLQIDIGESLRCLWHFAQIPAEIIASMSIEPARARVNVNINGAHNHSL
jgi:hypothetical protein